MKAIEIIKLLTEVTNNNKQVMLDVLQNGHTLLELGINNNDIESVEVAYDFIFNSI
jgi:hypothetical protein